MENNKIYPKNIDELNEFVKNAKTTNDFLSVQYLVSNFFYNLKKEDIEKILHNNYYIILMENVFNNQYFLEALNKVLEQYKYFKKTYKQDNLNHNFYAEFGEMEIKNKKLIFAALITSIILISTTISYLNKGNIVYTAKKLRDSIEKLKNQLDESYSSKEIFFILTSVFNQKYYTKKIDFPLKIHDLNFLYKHQKYSNYLISQSIKLYFRNSQLNSIFKRIENFKIEKKKFGTKGLVIINDFINSEKNNEAIVVNELNNLINSPVSISEFFESFKNNENDEKTFKLLELALFEFKSKETQDEDLLRTINNSQFILKQIEKYASNNFKAFSGSIKEDNYEWSNKIYLNCCKLFGVLSGTSKALDNEWKINVSIKEFAIWTSSIHQILNKFDIEDDMEKISRQLYQETNRIEWKSTFLTPTQIDPSNIAFDKVSKKIFYGIVKTIIGMINSDGGVIIIGLIEKPNEIINNEIKKNLIIKNKKYFYDVSSELSSRSLDLDGIKRKLQDCIKMETLISVDKFNNLWNIIEIRIKSEDGIKQAIIYKIEVSKSENLILSAKIDNNSDNEDVSINKTDDIWLSLLKRADARTIRVDPRKYLPSI